MVLLLSSRHRAQHRHPRPPRLLLRRLDPSLFQARPCSPVPQGAFQSLTRQPSPSARRPPCQLPPAHPPQAVRLQAVVVLTGRWPAADTTTDNVRMACGLCANVQMVWLVLQRMGVFIATGLQTALSRTVDLRRRKLNETMRNMEWLLWAEVPRHLKVALRILQVLLLPAQLRRVLSLRAQSKPVRIFQPLSTRALYFQAPLTMSRSPDSLKTTLSRRPLNQPRQRPLRRFPPPRRL
jgi:hypothetical protein